MSKRYFEAEGESAEAATAAPKKAGRPAGGSDPNTTTTLFISRLPFNATSTDLSTLFSDIGPLRKCFIVTDPSTKKSKGVGYVQYAIREDAERALKELDGKKQGVLDGKHAIRVEWAAKGRGSRQEREQKRAANANADGATGDSASSRKRKDDGGQSAPAKRPRRSNPYADEGETEKPETSEKQGDAPKSSSSSRDPLATRTLVLTGLSVCQPAADQKSLYKRIRKIADVESVVYPLDDDQADVEAAGKADGGKSKNDKKGKKKAEDKEEAPAGGDVAHVVFRTPNHAQTAQQKLEGRIFKGATLRAIIKRQHDGMSRLESSITNADTLARRAEVIQAIEEFSALPDLLVAAKSKVGGGKGKAPIKIQVPKVDGRLALTRAGGGAFASGKIEKRSRLIIRNLPFDVTIDDLKAVFLPFGPLYKIDLPQVEDARAKAKQRKAEESTEDDEESEEEEEQEESDNADAAEDEEEEDEEVAEGADVEMTEAEQGGEDASYHDEDDEEEDSQEEEEDGEGEDESEGGDESSDDEESADESEEAADESSKVEHVKVPTRGRGFAFIWFVVQADAAAALAAVNGTQIQHGALERAAYKAATQSRDRRKIKWALDKVKASAQPARTVAVDWSLSKDEWEKKKEEEDGRSDVETDVEEKKDGEDSDLDPIEVDEGLSTKPATTLPQPEEGTTLFIRNLPFNATEQELRDLFRAFGSMRYARITMDKATNRSKGSGFVCFWNKEDADKVLERAEQVQRESGMTGANAIMPAAGKMNPFSMSQDAAAGGNNNHYSSILTADVSAPMTASLSLHGRLLSITSALRREDAKAKEASALAARQKGDKRNTWLLREGIPFPNSPLAVKLTPTETDKRLQSFTIRRKQLETNPALFVSKTRLSVRNLPLFVTDKILKKLALHAVKWFATEVAQGSRADLSAEERLDTTMSAALEARSDRKKQKFKERPTAVIQSKVVRQQDRLDPVLAVKGLGRSRGYGFLEMRSFQDALKVVRWANANKDVTSLFVEWHIEELEGVIKLLRSEKQNGGESKMESTGKEDREDRESQLKRLVKRVSELKENGGKVEKGERGGLLMLEFSIENVTITRKRQERAEAQKRSAGPRDDDEEDRRPRRKEEDQDRSERSPDKAGGKKRENWNKKTSRGATISQKKADLKVQAEMKESKRAGVKKSSAPGRIIGKKRKERQAKKKGSS